MPVLYIIAGTNGVGKTTAAMSLLPDMLQVREFVNADEIARGLSPFNAQGVAVQAGRLMLGRMQELLEQREDFSFETTLASRSFSLFLRRAKEEGYELQLIYLWLDDPELAVRRVELRVKNGGHYVPEGDIRRRYMRSLHNLKEIYMPLVDGWRIYDNSMPPPQKLAYMKNGEIIVYNENKWQEILNI